MNRPVMLLCAFAVFGAAAFLMLPHIENDNPPSNCSSSEDTSEVNVILAAHNFSEWNEIDKQLLTYLMGRTAGGFEIDIPENTSDKVLEAYIDLLDIHLKEA